MNNFTVEGKCPGCGKDFVSVPTSWEGHLPSACNCNHCGAGLSWRTDDGGVWLRKFIPDDTFFKEGEEPTAEIAITVTKEA